MDTKELRERLAQVPNIMFARIETVDQREPEYVLGQSLRNELEAAFTTLEAENADLRAKLERARAGLFDLALTACKMNIALDGYDKFRTQRTALLRETEKAEAILSDFTQPKEPDNG